MKNFHAVCHDGFQYGDTGGKSGEDGGDKEQHAHHNAGPSHGGKNFWQGYKHQAGTGAHSLCAGKYKYGRDDHSACEQGHAGVKQFNLIDRPVQVDLRFYIRAVGDHDSHGHAEGEKELAHGVQQDLEKTAHRQPFHMGRQVIEQSLQAGAKLSVLICVGNGQGIKGNHHDQHQENGHHPFGDRLDAALDSPVHNKTGDSHKQQGVYHRGHRGGDKGGKVAVPRRRVGRSRQIDNGILGNPASDDRVVGHNQHRHQKGEDA